MWIVPEKISSRAEAFIAVVGRLVFICQKFEHTFARFSVVISDEDWDEQTTKGEDINEFLARILERHSRKRLHLKMKAVLERIHDEEKRQTFDELLNNCRDDRNYIVHQSIHFAEAIGVCDCDEETVSDYIEKELPKLVAAASRIIDAEDHMNKEDFWFNNKDAKSLPRPYDYKESLMKWIFQGFNTSDLALES